MELLLQHNNFINYTKKSNVKSIIIDFEEALINALNKNFPEVWKIGCLFHFTKAIRFEIGKLGLINNNFEHDDFIKEISSIPFYYMNDQDINNKIYNKFKEYYKKDNLVFNAINKFNIYFNKTWKKYLLNNMLNYEKLKKYQRTTSYLENYNKRNKDNLGKFI